MGSTLYALPGTMNVVTKQGEALERMVDFSVDLTGYTFAAEIVSAVTFSTVVEISVSAVDLEAGQVNVGIDWETAGTVAPGTYLWRMVWTPPAGSPRTALEGIWEVSR